MLSRLRRSLEDLVLTDDGAPRRTATALAIGVGLSFSPLLGLQILLGIAAALAFRLSRVAVLVGLCANVPWIMVPWYALTTAGAATLLGSSSPVDLGEHLARILSVPFYRAAFWRHAGDLLDAFFWPFLVGPSVGALALGAITYTIALRVLTRRAIQQAEAIDAVLALSRGLTRAAQERAADRHIDDAPPTGLELQHEADQIVERSGR